MLRHGKHSPPIYQSMNQNKQAVGAKFDLQKMRHARDKTFEAVNLIASQVIVGMSESQARAMAKATLIEMGMDRIWHQILVRFGVNTLKKFNEPSDGAPILQANDIFFVDLGVVWDGHEGDAGATFVVGNDADMQACAAASQQIFTAVKKQWETAHFSGQDLYVFAEQEAEKLGWKLNLEIKGHRVSDFPHAIYRAGDLGDFDQVPDVGLWILEIQIAHPTKPFGAFFEDLLVR